MMKRVVWLASTVLTSLITLSAYAFQEQDAQGPPPDWFLKDPQTEQYQGVGVEKAYETLLKDKPSRTVVVAVVDSGIDIEHEDLEEVIWVNEDEVAGNGIDDDKNGYVDDVHGWNFIGGKDGNVAEDTYEVTREYARLKPKYGNVKEEDVPKKQRDEYAYWKSVEKKFKNDSTFNKGQLDQFSAQYELYAQIYGTIHFCDSVLQKASGAPVNKATLSEIEVTNDTIAFAKETLTKILDNIEAEDLPVADLIAELEFALGQLGEMVNHYGTAIEYGYNLDFNPRTIVGDNPDDLYEKGYGNNDVEGPDARHGTHVAGIIAADRDNDLGVKGIADNVKIMAVRAVPNGDERDKDVANAILYAVDNGAHIINMSFGKKHSPHKEAVDKAIKYAESKGVLLVHGAGNDGDNIDTRDNFPSPELDNGKEVKNWLQVGASSWGSDSNFVASFSNYGKKTVDVFAPGVRIYSTVPDDEYEALDGTSMASPATAGIAALLMSYFPHLTAEEVKDIIKQSTRKFDGLMVTKPGTDEQVAFDELSETGGLVNAYEAVKLAMERNEPKGKR